MRSSELYLARSGAFALMPVVHYSYEFTLAARQAMTELNPCGLALEYPFTLQELVLQGIARLPRISILLYGEAAAQNFIRIEPIDPFVEAARIARAKNIEIRCIDLALNDYPEVYQPLPDTYAVAYLGHKKYCEMALAKSREVDQHLSEIDRRREQAMAFHLRELEHKLSWSGRLDRARPILVLCGLSHLPGLLTALTETQRHPTEPQPPAKLYHLSPSSLGEIMEQFPFFTAVFEAQRTASAKADRDEPAGDEVVNLADIESAITTFPAAKFEKLTHQLRLNLKLINGQPRETIDQFAERAYLDTAQGSDDRHEIMIRYLLWCRAYYESEIGEEINSQQLLLLANFARKYARVKARLLPEFYELLVAGRSCLSPHFCYRMWQIGTLYPPQLGQSELTTIELRAEDLFPLINRVRMNPHAPLKPRAPLPRFLRRKDKQQRANQERLGFDTDNICSYPPEDLVIEAYGRFLRGKGRQILSEERKRVRPFETSLLDGIDLRETIRNWHSGRIYVQETLLIKGAVDSLVVIFDANQQLYPYTMTWLGEHEDETDMAFYATDPAAREVAPGIRKAIYGGLLMTTPPGRLYDVFSDNSYQAAHNHAERLLMAAIDYSMEKFVIYAAQQPPRPFFQVLAGRYGKRIIYLPLKQLSPVMLQKIRSFHILANKSVRDYAKDHLW